MSIRSHGLSDALHAYIVAETLDEPELMRRLRRQTAALPLGEMQIAPEQGQFLRLLAELLRCRRAIELGTFTGYSALCIARALPDDGRLICCDISQEWTDLAKPYWREARVEHKIDLRLAPALNTLDALLADSTQLGAFDFIFIDADKENADAYYERSLLLLRPGGVIAVDNAFRGGRIVGTEPGDAATLAMRALNRKAARDQRVTASLVPIGDGLLMAMKRATPAHG